MNVARAPSDDCAAARVVSVVRSGWPAVPVSTESDPPASLTGIAPVTAVPPTSLIATGWLPSCVTGAILP